MYIQEVQLAGNIINSLSSYKFGTSYSLWDIRFFLFPKFTLVWVDYCLFLCSCEQKQNGEMDMRAFASPENGNNIYELLDGGADYAILEQTPSSVQNISTTINRHEYALLEGNTATVRSDQCGLWSREVEATVPAVGFYSSLNQQPDYAILESEPRGTGSTEVSGALLANGNTEEPHKYQRIVLDSTYDRTFTNNID